MKTKLVLGIAGTLVVVDAVTKWVIQVHFRLGESVPVLGDIVRLTYVLNPGAAFGLHVGPYSRQVFATLALVAVVVIAAVIRKTPAGERRHLVALSLIMGGALGNLVDRFRASGGVVDFLDVGFGVLRWPVFNLADVGVTTGAVLLVMLLWNEERGSPSPARAP